VSPLSTEVSSCSLECELTVGLRPCRGAPTESTLHFLTLPTLDPIPTALIQPIRGVITVAIDEGKNLYAQDGTGEDVGLCVIKRRGISVYRLGGRLFSVKVSPSPT
jgi:hypothetical protein